VGVAGGVTGAVGGAPEPGPHAARTPSVPASAALRNQDT
jgi:hypothetical protein